MSFVGLLELQNHDTRPAVRAEAAAPMTMAYFDELGQVAPLDLTVEEEPTIAA